MDQRIMYLTSLKDKLSRVPTEEIERHSYQQPEYFDNSQYLKLRQQVLLSDYYANVSKHVKIRILNWIKVLDSVNNNKIWQTNRDNYIKLLSIMCHCDTLIIPFHQLPPSTDPPHLRKHQINRILDLIEAEVKITRTTRISSRRNSQRHLNDYQRLKTTESHNEDTSTLPLLLRENNQEEMDIPLETFLNEDKSFNLSEGDHEVTKEQQKSRVISIQLNKSRSKAKIAPLKERQTNCNTKIKRNSMSKTQIKQNFPPLKRTTYSKVQKRHRPKNNQKKEYWEENNSGAQTPKYLTTGSLHEHEPEQVELASYRQNVEGCDCSGQVLGNGWLGSFLKKIL